MLAAIAALIVLVHLTNVVSASFDWSAWALFFVALHLALGGVVGGFISTRWRRSD